jgi:hypothetical protein
MQAIELSVMDTSARCPSQLVNMVCEYPDILQRSNGQALYRYDFPIWTKNGQILSPDGVMFDTSRSTTFESLRINTSMMSYEDIVNLEMECYLIFNINQTNQKSDPQSIMPPVINLTEMAPSVRIQRNEGIPVVIISMVCSDVLSTKFNIRVNQGDHLILNINTSNAMVPLEKLDGSKLHSVTVRALLTVNGEEHASPFSQPMEVPLDKLVYILPSVLPVIFIVFIIFCLIIFVILLRICYKHIKKVTPKQEEWICKEKC